jgi:heme-degrading monooxygenase HmoA
VPPTPWKTLRAPQPGREYVVLLTYLPMRKPAKLPAFFGYVRQIRAQLDGTSGVIAYSLLARPLRSQYWTLTVWESDEALRHFVREPPHADAMRELPRFLSGFRTTRWTADGSAVPPSWRDALERT